MVAPLRRRRQVWAFRVRRAAMRHALLGRSTTWRVAALLVFGAPSVRRLLGRRPEVVSVERLAPGQSVVVTRLRPGEGRRTR
jgi:hypothetical protein